MTRMLCAQLGHVCDQLCLSWLLFLKEDPLLILSEVPFIFFFVT